MANRLNWVHCGSPDGWTQTYCADVFDDKAQKTGTLYLTLGDRSQSMVYVADEVYVVDDTDYSKPPAA